MGFYSLLKLFPNLMLSHSVSRLMRSLILLLAPFLFEAHAWLVLQSTGRKALNNTDSESISPTMQSQRCCSHQNIFFGGGLHVLNRALTFFCLFCLQRFVLNKVVKGANVAMLAASICSAFVVLVMAYLGCRSLPRCSCYDSETGMVSEEPGAPM